MFFSVTPPPSGLIYPEKMLGPEDRAIDKDAEVTYCLAG
jgi:hypothetical protein